MNTPELILELTKFFFQSIWTYIGLLLLIIAIRGTIAKLVSTTIIILHQITLPVKNIFKKIRENYKAKTEERKIPSDVKRIIKN